jgi:uncharacterized Zn finger protein
MKCPKCGYEGKGFRFIREVGAAFCPSLELRQCPNCGAIEQYVGMMEHLAEEEELRELCRQVELSLVLNNKEEASKLWKEAAKLSDLLGSEETRVFLAQARKKLKS